MRFSTSLKTIFRYALVIGFTLMLATFIFHQEIFDKSDMKDDETPSPSPSASRESLDNVQLESTKMVSKKEGRIYWEIESESIKINEKTKKGEASKIKCTFFDEKGKPSMNFEAPAADIDLEHMSLFFKGKVNGFMATGEKMEAARLVWDGKKKRVYGYESITITRGASILKGKSLICDPQTRYVEIVGNVDVTWKEEKSADSGKPVFAGKQR